MPTRARPRGRSPARVRHPRRRLRVWVFGNIRAYKGVERLIEEFGSLEGDSLRLLVAGALHGNYHGPLHTAKIEDSRVIAHLRHIADEEVQLVMAAADVLVLPFPGHPDLRSAILALGHGTPLVLPRRGCLPELVGDSQAAVLYDPTIRLRCARRCWTRKHLIPRLLFGRPAKWTRD